MIDLEQFECTAAWLEYCDGMSRFQAETEAARRQGQKRHEVINAIRKRNTQEARDQHQAADRKSANNLPGVQPHQAQEKRSMPFRDVQAGWGAVVLLALQFLGGGVL